MLTSNYFSTEAAVDEAEDKTPRDSKSIRLTEDHEEVDCKIDGTSFVLKTCFLKK